MTAQGHVLVCGSKSRNVLQLDGEGKKKLATLATLRNSKYCPHPIFYNKSAACIIVGLANTYSYTILVFKVQ
ncbi:hypothetical protein DPMN_061099 [Dreissena polymorpha]|uniref:Uncharacterized protein n=1 Tax=Dreissena polymorpha TaxID=45954 RepID=A0A9D4HIV5_DREPO|nr:hypothetical protein DPMN_061099 [Dreissena polymorpha]